MNVYIKGMEMPTSCRKCIYSGWSNFYQIYVCNAVRKDEPVLFDHKQIKNTAIVRGGRADNCPLVPVPKHGRLIDADALCEGRASNDNVVICAKCAPTIIPASED